MWKYRFLLSVLLAASSNNGLVDAIFGGSRRNLAGCESPCVPGDESIMSQKEHGTSHVPVQENLRWGCPPRVADKICNFNRHYAGASLF